MTRLNCSVCDCASNKNNCCCRPDIDVGGSQACHCEETCCNSYTEKKGSMSNSAYTETPNQSLSVSCMAENCVFNAKGKCSATEISIANGISGTECSSFKEKH